MLYTELGKAAETPSTSHLSNPKGALSTLHHFTMTPLTNSFCFPGIRLGTEHPVTLQIHLELN